jgi:hypothetical protein
VSGAGYPVPSRVPAPVGRTLPVWGAAVAAAAVTCAFYYPGVMSGDSLGLYGEALAGRISGDSKPSMTPFLWMWLLRVHQGPFVLLMFQNIVFWAGLAAVITACRLRAPTAVGALVLMGFYPAVFALLGTLWIDVLLGAFLTAFVGVVLHAAGRRSMVLTVVAGLLLFCALAVRPNAALAVLPLAGWLVVAGAPANRERVARPWFTCAAAFLFVLLLFGLVQAFERVVARDSAGARRALQFSMLHDLAGIGVATGDLRLPAHVRAAAPEMTLGAVRQLYRAEDVNPLIFDPRWGADAVLTRVPAHFHDLVRTWARTVTDHPEAYARRRFDVITSLLQARDVFYPFHRGIDENHFGLRFPGGPIYDALTGWLLQTRMLFFRGWVFVLASVAVVMIAVRRCAWEAAAVSASGLAYVAPYAFVSTGADFRYVWWLVISCLLGLVLTACRSAQHVGRNARAAYAPEARRAFQA